MADHKFFSEVIAFFLPYGIGKLRSKIMKNQMELHGATCLVEDSDFENVTHFIIDESCDVELIRKFLSNYNISEKVKVVYSKWVSHCLEHEILLDVKNYLCLKNNITDTILTSSNLSANMISSLSDSQHVFNTQNTLSAFALNSTDQNLNANYSQNPEQENPNYFIIQELEKLSQSHSAIGDNWRALSYQKAARFISRLSTPIATEEEAHSVPGIGSRISSKICEILQTGHLRKADNICLDEKQITLELFNSIWGVGPSTALQWYHQGKRSLNDIASLSTLTAQQKIGIKYHDDLKYHIPHTEIDEIFSYIALSILPGIVIYVCGSYRRGQCSCGDVDMVITHEDSNELNDFGPKFHKILHSQVDDLVFSVSGDGHWKYLGICHLQEKRYRRIDLFAVPKDCLAAALLHYTGSANYNRFLRSEAKKRGMKLTEVGLFQVGYIGKLDTSSEEIIHELIGVEYLSPEFRNM